MKYVAMNSCKAVCCGTPVRTENTGKAMLAELYRNRISGYPKFYKMDGLCQAGFVMSELLIESLGEERFVPREDRAVMLFNRTSSIEADSRYQATVSDKDNYFPSPSVFVYTLPNIVTGEIAIRNKYFGETSFYVLERFDAAVMARNIACAFADEATRSVLGGWIDCAGSDRFGGIMFLADREEAADETALARQIDTMYNIIM